VRHGAASQQLGLGTHEGLYSCRWVDDALQHGVTETPRPSGPTRMLPKFRSHPFVMLLLLCSFMPKKTDVLLAAEDELERRGYYRSAAYLNDPTGTNHSLSWGWERTRGSILAVGSTMPFSMESPKPPAPRGLHECCPNFDLTLSFCFCPHAATVPT